MIELKKIRRVFTTEDVETSALDSIDLTVLKGEFVAVMGPSGCGKSTLLSVLGMLDAPSSGEYIFLGENVAKHGEGRLANIRNKSIGFIYQSFNLIDELTVAENVELPLQYQGVSRQERKARTEQVLNRFEMQHRAGHYPHQLSGGQQQRVAVARAVVTRPNLVLADEPTGNLDSKNGIEVMRILRELNREGTTVVMVTHSSYDAEFATRVVQMLDGRISKDSRREKLQEAAYAHA